ncbi:PPK2 family polyphosphate kinase [Bdellovibrio sp. HCB209]|uniref:PPK2 family polyphosphate kinase n=1 Tax=Bdellovibrio sp. HCB209 TaxID=3394354 RepID=UPI0039B39261
MIKEKSFYPTKKNLNKVPTLGDHNGLSKKDLKSDFAEISEKLGDLQELIFAESKHKVLIILQGLDTSGKDGTVKHVFAATNPQGLRVASFKRPTDLEARHDYLWRVHSQTPEKGEFVIFNRSHYEDVIIPTVHQTLPRKHIAQRIEDINAFEKMLVSEGMTLFKFFLHISSHEQALRLKARIDNPKKHWKFELSDLEERKHWKSYQHAYTDIIQKTHHKDRPWNIIPADDKDLRNYIISSILVERLEKLKPKLPQFNKETFARINKEIKKLL